jgi:hypothetical protein
MSLIFTVIAIALFVVALILDLVGGAGNLIRPFMLAGLACFAAGNIPWPR